MIILSVNEEVLPSSGNSPSFIPFSIRKAFGLPTYEEQHAVSAYHFYRLLQRASNIHLLYNTESKKVAGGEKSRFLLQIEHELAAKFSKSIRLSEKIISTGFNKEKNQPIEITKSDEVMEILQKFLPNPQLKSKFASRFSASALNTYISCKLRYYFQNIVKLKEKEEPEEDMEAATFGKVLHKAMELAYNGVVELTSEALAKITAKAIDYLDEAISIEYSKAGELEGKNILLKNVMHELILKIFKADKKEVPFLIHALEKDVIMEFSLNEKHSVLLYGLIDRIDEDSTGIRIVDYKTGKVSTRKFEQIADLFHDPQYKEQLQAMLYAYMVRNNYPGKSIRSGLVTLKDMSQGIWYLQQGQAFSSEQFAEFEIQLRLLISDILDPATAFTQTEDETRCKYCSFIEICNR